MTESQILWAILSGLGVGFAGACAWLAKNIILPWFNARLKIEKDRGEAFKEIAQAVTAIERILEDHHNDTASFAKDNEEKLDNCIILVKELLDNQKPTRKRTNTQK